MSIAAVTIQTADAPFWQSVSAPIIAGVAVPVILAYRSNRARKRVHGWMSRLRDAAIVFVARDNEETPDDRDPNALRFERDPETARCIGYMSHLRDVAHAFGELQETPSSNLIDNIAKTMLVPVLSYIPHEGYPLTAVWLRPDGEQRDLIPIEAAGRPLEDFPSYPVNSSVAGKAFRTGYRQSVEDCATSSEVHRHGDKQPEGSLICVPMRRAGNVVGVLAVWSRVPKDFWVSEVKYLETVAAAIGSLENNVARALSKTSHREASGTT